MYGTFKCFHKAHYDCHNHNSVYSLLFPLMRLDGLWTSPSSSPADFFHFGVSLDGNASLSFSRSFRSPVLPTFQGNSSTHIKQTIVKVNFMMLWGWQKRIHGGKAYQAAKLLCTWKYNNRSKKVVFSVLFYTFQQRQLITYKQKRQEKNHQLYSSYHIFIYKHWALQQKSNFRCNCTLTCI